MGQYWLPVNLTKREYIDPHKLGSGLKLCEQVANEGVGRALIILLANFKERRGGGDLCTDPKRPAIIGSWAGDEVTLVGDYAEDADYTPRAKGVKMSKVYGLCHFDENKPPAKPFKDVTDEVCAVIEAELEGKFEGDGWRSFVTKWDTEQAARDKVENAELVKNVCILKAVVEKVHKKVTAKDE